MRFPFSRPSLRSLFSLGGGARAVVALLGAGLCARLTAADATAETRPPAIQSVSFAQLAACPLFVAGDPVTLPAPIAAAQDHAVRVIGYMLPLSGAMGQTQEFLLLRNQNACCFGRMPAANEYLLVRADAAVAIRMDVPVAIEGTLRLAPICARGSFLQFYLLENAHLATAAN